MFKENLHSFISRYLLCQLWFRWCSNSNSSSKYHFIHHKDKDLCTKRLLSNLKLWLQYVSNRIIFMKYGAENWFNKIQNTCNIYEFLLWIFWAFRGNFFTIRYDARKLMHRLIVTNPLLFNHSQCHYEDESCKASALIMSSKHMVFLAQLICTLGSSCG